MLVMRDKNLKIVVHENIIPLILVISIMHGVTRLMFLLRTLAALFQVPVLSPHHRSLIPCTVMYKPRHTVR